jgi:hypothetical protein
LRYVDISSSSKSTVIPRHQHRHQHHRLLHLCRPSSPLLRRKERNAKKPPRSHCIYAVRSRGLFLRSVDLSSSSKSTAIFEHSHQMSAAQDELQSYGGWDGVRTPSLTSALSVKHRKRRHASSEPLFYTGSPSPPVGCDREFSLKIVNALKSHA